MQDSIVVVDSSVCDFPACIENMSAYCTNCWNNLCMSHAREHSCKEEEEEEKDEDKLSSWI